MEARKDINHNDYLRADMEIVRCALAESKARRTSSAIGKDVQENDPKLLVGAYKYASLCFREDMEIVKLAIAEFGVKNFTD